MGRIVHSVDWMQYAVTWPDYVWEWPIDDGEARKIIRTCVPHLHVAGKPYERPDDNHVNGMKGYRLTYDYGYASAHVDPQRRDMKVGVRMTGQDLGVWRDLGGDDKRLINFVKGAKGSTSRVDIAFDLFDYGIDVKRFYDDWKRGKVRGHFRTVQPLTKGTVGEKGEIVEATTVYFGSRTSEIMVRAYEKGKEQNTDVDWVRIELEIKGDKAKVVTDDMHRLGIAETGKQLLRDYFTAMPYKFWKQLTQGESSELTPVGRKMTEREAWIRNVVFPVLREEIAKEWDSCVETGMTRDIEALIREHWAVRAMAIKKQYGQL